MKNKMKLVVVMVALLLCFTFSTELFAVTIFGYRRTLGGGIILWRPPQPGYVDGYGDAMEPFARVRKITRAELTKIFSGILGLQDGAGIIFTDVGPEYWYYDWVNSAVYAGFIDGYGDNTFRPNNYITRQEAAKMLGYCVPDNAPDLGGIDSFVDKDDIGNWAVPYVTLVINKRYFRGDNEDCFNPTGTLTRAEAATILVRMMEGENIISDPEVSPTGALADSIYSNGINGMTEGSIDSCTLLGSSTLMGQIALENVHIHALVNTSNLALTANDILVDIFTANAPVFITGNGVISCLDRHVPDANFCSSIIAGNENVVLPGSAYYLQVEMETGDDTYFLNIAYDQDDTIFSAVESFLDNENNAAAINSNLIVPMNNNIAEIRSLEVNGVPLYSETGWQQVVELFDGTGANAAALDLMKPDFEEDITLLYLQDFMDGFNGLYPTGLSSENRDLMLQNFNEMDLVTTSSGSGAPVTFSYFSRCGTLTDPHLIGQSWIERILWTGDNVDTFFAGNGCEVYLTAVGSTKTVTVTLRLVTLVQ